MKTPLGGAQCMAGDWRDLKATGAWQAQSKNISFPGLPNLLIFPLLEPLLERETFSLKVLMLNSDRIRSEGLRDGALKGDHCQAWRPELASWNLHGGRQEMTSASCHLTSTCTQHSGVHTHTHVSWYFSNIMAKHMTIMMGLWQQTDRHTWC